MSDPIRWSDREMPERFSMVMLTIFVGGIGFLLTLDGFDKLANGDTLLQRVSGGLIAFTWLGLAIAFIRKWRSRNAR
jgi:hypothetical protein